MKSSSLLGITTMESLKRLGITSPREYRDALIHEWYLDNRYICGLNVFFLRKLKPAVLLDTIKNGEFIHQGKSYSVTWISKPETIRKADWCLSSFRFCPYLNTGYVLIKSLKGDHSEFEELV